MTITLDGNKTLAEAPQLLQDLMEELFYSLQTKPDFDREGAHRAFHNSFKRHSLFQIVEFFNARLSRDMDYRIETLLKEGNLDSYYEEKQAMEAPTYEEYENIKRYSEMNEYESYASDMYRSLR